MDVGARSALLDGQPLRLPRIDAARDVDGVDALATQESGDPAAAGAAAAQQHDLAAPRDLVLVALDEARHGDQRGVGRADLRVLGLLADVDEGASSVDPTSGFVHIDVLILGIVHAGMIVQGATLPRMDPYLDRLLSLLGDRDPIDVLRETPLRLEAMGQDRDRAWDVPWRDGGGGARQIVAHLADHEMAFGFRARQVVAAGEAGHEAQPFDPDAWARDYARLDPTLAIEAFRALRAWNLAWLARLELVDWLRAYRHPECAEEETIDELVRRLAGHDLNHLAQLDERAVAAW